MTRVYLEQDGIRYSVICHEHAKSAEVCTAISTLLYTLDGYLHNIQCERDDEILDPGDAKIIYRAFCPEAQAAFDMTAVGFLQLQSAYPEDVSVDIQTIR